MHSIHPIHPIHPIHHVHHIHHIHHIHPYNILLVCFYFSLGILCLLIWGSVSSLLSASTAFFPNWTRPTVELVDPLTTVLIPLALLSYSTANCSFVPFIGASKWLQVELESEVVQWIRSIDFWRTCSVCFLSSASSFLFMNWKCRI